MQLVAHMLWTGKTGAGQTDSGDQRCLSPDPASPRKAAGQSYYDEKGQRRDPKTVLSKGNVMSATLKMSSFPEMAGWHHQLNGHRSEQTLGDSEVQGSLACCSPWGHKESDMTVQLNNNS